MYLVILIAGLTSPAVNVLQLQVAPDSIFAGALLLHPGICATQDNVRLVYRNAMLSPDFHDNGFRQTILHGGAKMMCGDVSVCLYDTILVCSPDHFVDQCRFQKDWEGTTHCSYCGGCHPCVSEVTILNPPSTNMMPLFVCELYIILYLYICTFQ